MKRAAKIYTALIFVFLFAPIAILLVFSFNDAKSLSVFSGFSLKWYYELFRDAETLNALKNTLILAVIASIVSTVMGTAAAVGMNKLRSKYLRAALDTATDIPMMNPDIITGISLFLLFVSLGISQGLTTVVLAHITFCTPYVVLSVMPRLKQMNQNIYEAALDLGATPFQALRKVIFPEIRPGMISGFILAFTLSIDDFAVTIFTIGNEGLETLSTFIYADARKGGLTPELRPLSTIIFVTVLVLLIVINKRAEKAKRA